ATFLIANVETLPWSWEHSTEDNYAGKAVRTKSNLISILGGAVPIFIASVASRAEVVVNEIMYHPASINVLEEWIELFNRGTSQVNMSGWRFTDGVQFTIPDGTTIPGGGFVVVAANAATFRDRHPDLANFVGGWERTLGDDGDVIRLENGAEGEDCLLSYGPQGDWAVLLSVADRYWRRDWEWYAEHDGLGKSAELVNAALPAGNGLNWSSTSVEGAGTPATGIPGRFVRSSYLFAGLRGRPYPASDPPVARSWIWCHRCADPAPGCGRPVRQ
ncbi:MAG: Inner spore coat protein, partial [Verrucomicrobiota bacterium]